MSHLNRWHQEHGLALWGKGHVKNRRKKIKSRKSIKIRKCRKVGKVGNGSKWVQMSQNWFKRLQMSPNGSKWIQLDPTESKWLQRDPHGSKWLQIAPKGDAENPIHNTLSKPTSAIFSVYKRPTGVCLQS